jgi:hypothetical protein
MILEFHLVFFYVFSDFFFKNFKFKFQNSLILEFGPARFHRISANFKKKIDEFVNPGGQWCIKLFLNEHGRANEQDIHPLVFIEF